MSAAHLDEILKRLELHYKDAECSLSFRNPYELTVATILSAQCTDERVNKVTPALFQKFPDAAALSKGKPSEVEKLIQSTGFFRNKAKSLLGMAKKVVQLHEGRIPDSLDALVHLPGIGRKTANVVLGNAFQKPAGVVVDTHVKRLAYRLGLTKNSDPTKVEMDLNRIIPEARWTALPHWLIAHGRAVCQARKPDCGRCPLVDLCPQKGLTAAQKRLRAEASSSKLEATKQRRFK